eukprot:353590-Chlamydomonas_euryale.AAC.18
MLYCSSARTLNASKPVPSSDTGMSASMSSKISRQWRVASAGLASSSTSGRICLKSSIESLKRITTGSSLYVLPILYARVA